MSTQTKTLLDLMKSKYSPFLPVSKGRQTKLSFGQTNSGVGGDSASDDDDDDDDDDEDEDEDDTQGSQ